MHAVERADLVDVQIVGVAQAHADRARLDVEVAGGAARAAGEVFEHAFDLGAVGRGVDGPGVEVSGVRRAAGAPTGTALILLTPEQGARTNVHAGVVAHHRRARFDDFFFLVVVVFVVVIQTLRGARCRSWLTRAHRTLTRHRCVVIVVGVVGSETQVIHGAAKH